MTVGGGACTVGDLSNLHINKIWIIFIKMKRVGVFCGFFVLFFIFQDGKKFQLVKLNNFLLFKKLYLVNLSL